MKIVRNNIIPFKGFAAINLFGVLFIRRSAPVSQRMINHESIHTAQMRELFYIGFYLWYVLEWIVRIFQYGVTKKAYYNISFEREAYGNEYDADYLIKCIRKRYEFLKYLKE